ncbi:hypothetical protein RND81_10G043600 [Saponaria officinalis]|uniref:R13L1/DRL21-like LRR repeat region domain-containing protein n=1 Tax=Saponaria officinalis TaxID=3572 RepID=A0AAW1I0A7_SAPOF
MSSVTNNSQPLAALLVHGKTLVGLLRRAKTEGGNKTIHEEVKKVVFKLLENLDLGQSVASFPDESISKLFRKVEKTLEEFILLDPGNKSCYEDVVVGVRNSKHKMQSTSVALLRDSTGYREAVSHEILSQEEFEAIYEGLSSKEKRCLLCFTLFPSGVQIKKRELIHLWLGLDLIDFCGDQMLDNLVAEGLVERVIANKRLSGMYLMHDNVRCQVLQQCVNNSLGHHSVEGSWCTLHMMMHHQQQIRGSIPHSDGSHRGEKIGALLNISEKTLNVKRFESLSKMKNVKVLHLGSWQHDPKNYIVVDDIEVFRDLKHMGDVQVLSLQGVSGIVKLPDSVYKLENLKVLDLKACHSLESIPEGIDALKQLTHVDLSECYLLDHVPQGIASLPRLQVLKGFVINRHDNLDEPAEIGSTAKGHKHRNRIAFVASCRFHDLLKLEELRKLSVRTRSMGFPTNFNLGTLCRMKKLTSLRIAWVGSATDAPEEDEFLEEFPPTLLKMELQAAPEHMSWRMLCLLSRTDNCLQKLYIRGGGLRELDNVCLIGVKVVRLRYLPNLHIDWDDFRNLFPNLTRLEVLECPKIFFSPCDENGIWEAPFQPRMSMGPINDYLIPYLSTDSASLHRPPPPLPLPKFSPEPFTRSTTPSEV